MLLLFIVPANFTSSGILVTPFKSNTKCDVIIRKNLSPNDVLSSGAHEEGHDGVSSIHVRPVVLVILGSLTLRTTVIPQSTHASWHKALRPRCGFQNWCCQTS